ncbi:MAG: DUF4293 domain-containing protein, partial [Muribaculaceae bacterium]|nr:DUF4293 domain-containing protein [Muribaculaceae bacterium]
MVIQRIQTLFLLLAVGFMILFCLTPFASAEAAAGLSLIHISAPTRLISIEG